MKISSRFLSCVGAVTLVVVACNDKDISLINADAGAGGSSPGIGGSGGSSGSAGQGGSSNGGNGGTSTAGSAGSSAGTAGSGTSGAGGSSEPPDGGVDSGPPPGPYAELCANYCAARTAWATATTDAGVNCAGFDSAGCQAACEGEVQGFVDTGCTAAPPAYECHTTADAWVCLSDSVVANNCESNFGFDGTNFTCGTNCDSTCNAQAAAANACFGIPPLCGG